jgi:hypothetical protein
VLDVAGEVRGLVGELRPAGLAEFGLPAALGVTVIGAALSGLLAVALTLTMMVAFARRTLIDALAMMRTVGRSAFGRGRAFVRREPARAQA